MASPNRRVTTQIPRVLEQGHAICSGKLYTARKIALVSVEPGTSSAWERQLRDTTQWGWRAVFQNTEHLPS